MKISINKKLDYKPENGDPSVFWSLAHEFVNVDINIDELAKHIKLGHPFCAQHHPIRNSQNFTCAGYLAVDIDNGMTLADALENDWVKKYAALVYVTWSHTKEHNRFRIVFELARIITDAQEMRAAFIGLIRKFGGDGACKDVCRIFYGSKDGQQFMLGNMLPDEILDELIEIGKTKKISAESGDESGNWMSAVRSNRHLDADHAVKTAEGSIEQVTTLSRTARVHCPFHLDKHPSAFITVSSNNIKGVHCTTCDETFWPKSISRRNLQNFDFYQIDDELNKIEYYEDPYNIYGEDSPAEFFSNDDRVVRSGNEKRLANLELMPGVILVRSPKGSGKSYQLAKIVNQCKQLNKSVLLIGHRQSLIAALAENLGLACYLDKTDADGERISVSKYYAICLDSIPLRLKLNLHKFDVVIIDESEQVFSHLTSDTLAKQRRDCFLKMERYLRNASTVIACDADLSHLTLAVISNARGGEMPVRFYVNRHKQSQRNIEIYDSQDQLLSELISAVNSGGKYYVTCNSKKKADQIAKALEESATREIKIQLITKENSQDKEIRGFVKNIKTEILEFDVVISSPSLGTGIDITFPDDEILINGVFGFFLPRINTHFDIDQQLCRVRHPGFVKVWISHERFSFEIEPEAIKRNIVESGSFTDFLIGYDDNNNKTYDIDDSLLSLHAVVFSLGRASKNNIRTHFIDLKKYNGWNVIEVATNKKEAASGRAASNAAKKELARMRAQMICDAEKITETQARNLQEATNRTAFVNAKIDRFWIERFYGEEISLELVELDDEQRYQEKVKMMAVYLSDDDQSIDYDKPQQSKFAADRNFSYFKKLLLRKLFIAAKLADSEGNFIENKRICNDDLDEFVKICDEKRGEIETLLKLDVRGDLHPKPMNQLGNFLKLIGCSWVKPINSESKKGRIRYYSINQYSLNLAQKYAKNRLKNRRRQ
ncbi:plasmid replication protein, CyRepA1 family [Pseudoduganella namucuonensis]|uniref:Origin of replication binding protein n=1 Tax=Pseudoduganella namucuonensis TaxID=1035707 RepID=A0A1I7M3K9_9BURK|nr:plasmid replication protein, CyRepA1 family [Pseudoduganella namucuonensis]SFV16541.1 Origin of replication binding protein [Pseudoduganella namucuonensis]